MVHNIAYLRFVELARSEFAEVLGWSLKEMRLSEVGQSSLVPVVVRTEIDYVRPARLGDRLIVTVELLALERVRFRLGFRVLSAEEPAILHARCEQVMATLELPSGKPKRVPEAWTKAFGEKYGHKS